MFLYLGEGKYKRLSSLIGIFDMDSATVCVATRRFLAEKEKEGNVESDGELPKSFLLYEKENEGITKNKRKKVIKTKKEKKRRYGRVFIQACVGRSVYAYGESEG